MTITVKSRTNIFVIITTNIYDELFPRKCSYSLKKHY